MSIPNWIKSSSDSVSNILKYYIIKVARYEHVNGWHYLLYGEMGKEKYALKCFVHIKQQNVYTVFQSIMFK